MARAREEFGVEFRVAWHPYFLDFQMPRDGLTKREHYAKKGMDERRLAKMERKMRDLFAGEGISYTLDGPTGNTMDSHRLAAWAYTEYGAELQDRLVEVLFRRFFSDAQSPADHDTLVSAAEEVGIDGGRARAFLESGQGRDDVVRTAQSIMSQPTVTGVPHYAIAVEGTGTEDLPQGVRAQVPGAQDAETFYLVLRQLVQKARGRLAASKL
mmetsp:Transcript_94537/g.282284  ORF Transcript_94537/g.282284 Transcript_94537/m.282284 type:complete len:212 (-) Transcript_94537:82-717(-)